MILQAKVHEHGVRFDSTAPIDLSTSLVNSAKCVNAFFVEPPRFEPLQIGTFIGSVAQGGSCNCENLFLNAHGNGTHTECVGHISSERNTINQCLREFLFIAELITVEPQPFEERDFIITREHLEQQIKHRGHAKALIIRTAPNDKDKLHRQWSGTNPTYLHQEAAHYIVDSGYDHLLIDLPSVDREEDGGELLAHHAFWTYPEQPRMQATITEMIYVPDTVADGLYLLNIQIASFESDASPSKPVLYRLEE